MVYSREDRLVAKRLAERRRRARIKNDPEKYSVQKEKDRQRYYQKKKEGKIKSIRELDPRQQRIARERSRISSNKHNAKKRRIESKCLEEALVTIPEAIDENGETDPLITSQTKLLEPGKSSTPLPPQASFYIDQPTSPSVVLSSLARRTKACQESPTSLSPSSDVSGISKHRTRSSARFLEFAPNLQRRVNRRLSVPQSPSSDGTAYSGPYNGSAGRRLEFPPTPRLKRKIDKKNDTKVTIRRLKYKMNKMFNLQQKKINDLKTVNERYRKQIYRLKCQNNNLINCDEKKKNAKAKIKLPSETDTINVIKQDMEQEIKTFLEEDENSRMSSGKKEFITKKKDKKQRRYLNDSLKDLHEKFKEANPQTKVSYASFCKKRPFWILKPNINQRETCLCIEHENMDLMVTALRNNNIIQEKSNKDILSSLCCDFSSVSCLTRECNNCKDRTLSYEEFDNDKESFYWAWQKLKQTYTKNEESKTTVHTAKVKVIAYPRDIILQFEKMLPKYLTHCGIMIAQNRFIKEMKSNLTDKECIIHCDFSENYSTKYANEIQAVHFGGNRQQITLHTVVIYYRKNGNQNVQSMCTLSESLRHDAAAIWEHIIPILKFIEDENLCIQTLHFISDSPSGQYRNRKMFYIISKLHWHLPSLSSISWNYTESGHGKGAPDGVGATLKRTADRIVAQGKDITNLSSLLTHLKSVEGIITETINDSGIYQKELLIPSNLKQFAGTMRVHQVVWNANEPNQLSMRKISCAKDNCKNNSVPCKHGHHIGMYIIGENSEKTGKQQTVTAMKTKKSNNIKLIKKTRKNEIGEKDNEIDEKLNNKPKILSNTLIKPGSSYFSEFAIIDHEAQRQSQTLPSDFELPENDSFWTHVSTDCENIVPTVLKENFSKSNEDSDYDYNIF